MVADKAVTADDLAAEPVEIVKVVLDDKGACMFVGSLTADDFVEWTEAREAGGPESKKNAAALLIVRSLVKGEKDATRIGTDAMIPKFRATKVAKTEKLLKAIFALNGINQKNA